MYPESKPSMEQYLAELKKKSTQPDRLSVSDNTADLQTRVRVGDDLHREEAVIQERAFDKNLIDGMIMPMFELASPLLEAIKSGKQQITYRVLEGISELGPLAEKDENGLEKIYLRIIVEHTHGQLVDWVNDVEVGDKGEDSAIKNDGKINVEGLKNAARFLKDIESGINDEEDNLGREEFVTKVGEKLNLEKGSLSKLLGYGANAHLKSLEVLKASELNEMAKLEAVKKRVQES
jgi:hypothetical protein